MNAQIESSPEVTVSGEATKTENPMQERYCSPVAESVGVTAEAAFTAGRLESRVDQGDVLSLPKGRSTRGESGAVFVP